MELSFSNLLVRNNSFLSFGESYKYSVLYYLILKRFLTTHWDCIFTVNGVFNYLSLLCNETDVKVDKYKRQKKYFQLFLKRLFQTEIFSGNVKIKNNNELIILQFNADKENSYGFTYVNEDHVKNILQYNGNDIDNVKLLNLYCDISSRIFQSQDENIHKYCYPAFDNFIYDGVLGRKDSIVQYLDILVQLDLIRYKGVGQMCRGKEVRNGVFHYVLTKDYVGYSEKEYEKLFGFILDQYVKEKDKEGWSVVRKL